MLWTGVINLVLDSAPVSPSWNAPRQPVMLLMCRLLPAQMICGLPVPLTYRNRTVPFAR